MDILGIDPLKVVGAIALVAIIAAGFMMSPKSKGKGNDSNKTDNNGTGV